MKYLKGYASLLATALTLLVGALTDNTITLAEGLTAAGALVGTIAVIGLPNLPGNPAVKTVAQAAAPALSGLAVALITPEGLTASVLVQLAIVSLGAIGVEAATNRGDTYARKLSEGRPVVTP